MSCLLPPANFILDYTDIKLKIFVSLASLSLWSVAIDVQIRIEDFSQDPTGTTLSKRGSVIQI